MIAKTVMRGEAMYFISGGNKTLRPLSKPPLYSQPAKLEGKKKARHEVGLLSLASPRGFEPLLPG